MVCIMNATVVEAHPSLEDSRSRMTDAEGCTGTVR